jgi:hypothetical protein
MDATTAIQSVRSIDQNYKKFNATGDRVGQHRAMSTALAMFNRARWEGKFHEAAMYRHWLVNKLYENERTDSSH